MAFRNAKRSTKKMGRAAEEEIHFGMGKSSLGVVVVASSDKGVVAILMGEDGDGLIHDLQERFPQAHLVHGHGDRESVELVTRVVEFIEKPARGLDLQLDVRGTVFQRKVWRAVREVPVGRTSTYSEIARKIGAPKAMRAVGTACSNNNISLAIPCHRVLRKDGSLCGSIVRQGALIGREAEAVVGRKKKVKG
ncbi:MAG: methylated-DNA--[protein]-cysteine S-methyltransferase [Chthoniobacteraceae bacterium]